MNCRRKDEAEIYLEHIDEEWPFQGVTHDRHIARAIVVDDDGYFYFVRADRDDDFGRAVVIETAGGGMEEGENPESAILRELREELGADTEIICKIGVVSDYYNLIKRHNVNNYFLCRAKSFQKPELTEDEINKFHLSTLRMTYDEAMAEYERSLNSRLGRIIGKREIPILKRAKEILDKRGQI